MVLLLGFVVCEKLAHIKLRDTGFSADETVASKRCVDAFCKKVKNFSSAVVNFSHGKHNVRRGYERRFHKPVVRCTGASEHKYTVHAPLEMWSKL